MITHQLQRSNIWHERLKGRSSKVHMPNLTVSGTLTRIVGLTLEAEGCRAAIGGRCMIEADDKDNIEAEVVGFGENKLFLMPTGEVHGLIPGARVVPSRESHQVRVGNAMLGRVLDPAGNSLDGKGPMILDEVLPLTGKPTNPLSRAPIHEPLDVGVRSINSMLTVGRGQRMGLFAGTGVGKSILLGMMTKFTNADVVVVGLIGERGREVAEFVQKILGEEGLTRSVVVASPADNPPLMRMHGALYATTIAEYFRDQGKQVLLLMDSLTRYAQAQREISLAIGEPPATKGYPPSVFAKLPHLVERAGNGEKDEGSITAFYTVLTEGDDTNDPIADAARGVLDGHIVLSRDLADSGHYPAIDIGPSVSRVMPEIIAAEHQQNALRLKRIYSTYMNNRDLISVGAYQPGSDPKVDEAIATFPRIEEFLCQGMKDQMTLENSVHDLESLFNAQ